MCESNDITAVELAVSHDANVAEAWETLVWVSVDGCVQLNSRFTDDAPAKPTSYCLTKTQVIELFHLVLCTDTIKDIDVTDIEDLMQSADAQQNSSSTFSVGMSATKDGVFSRIRVSVDGNPDPLEWVIYNLAGAASRYADIKPLQRLRRIQLWLLDLATDLSHR